MMTVPPQFTSSLPSFSYPASFRHPPPASSQPTGDDIRRGATVGPRARGPGSVIVLLLPLLLLLLCIQLFCWRWPSSLSSFCIVWPCLMWLQWQRLQLWYVMVGRHDRSYDDRFFAYRCTFLPVMYLPVILWAEGYKNQAEVSLLAIHTEKSEPESKAGKVTLLTIQ